MLLLLTSLAAAAPPSPRTFLAAVAELGSLEVEMPPLDIRATRTGRSMWSRVPDGMAVEMALEKYGIAPGDASLISVEVVDGQTRLDWSEVATGSVRLRVEKVGDRAVCTVGVAAGIWNGGNDVRIYRPTPSGADNVAASPGFLLIEDDPNIGALVSLAPGDSATVYDVSYDGHLIREVVSVARPSGTVRVERKKGEERICYVPPPRNTAGR